MPASFSGYDIAYWAGLGIAAPYWLVKPSARRKVLHALRERRGQRVPHRESSRPCVMIHAVSLGEVNATKALIEQLRSARHDLSFAVSVTTETGFDQAKKLYGENPEVLLVRYPLDVTGAIQRVLDGIRPSVVVLMELELWPNFIRRCQQREIPVVLANGRITLPSFRKYKLIGPVTRKMFSRLARVCAQDETYAERFVALGAPAERVRVTGTMKFDTAQISDRVPGDLQLAWDVGLYGRGERVWVCGSTGPGEEDVILEQYRALLKDPKVGRFRLAIIPRHPQRFDEVADLIEQHRFPVILRSQRQTDPGRNNDPIPPVVLGDTMGELRRFYAIASVVFVGRTLVDLGPRQHGSDMIEPAALGKAVIVGPYTGNFAEPMTKFRQAKAVREVTDGESLRAAVAELLTTPREATLMGQRARYVVKEQQGATARHAAVIVELLPAPARVRPVAPG
jgi:3-deoxy-D-manno-octulosonic-acid transferase